ncbi:hypothetical protein Gorai_023246 [Gossypium raimondii]|uniref:Uncharacterized protein n=1 Tax=Gossypium raimondii TaxID=29730 RepID=A0A7J8NW50_GOSRA|nr:hypothetical protein [Gossypium raimondii]
MGISSTLKKLTKPRLLGVALLLRLMPSKMASDGKLGAVTVLISVLIIGGLEGLNREVIKSNLLSHNEYNVRELWHVESRSWNTCRVYEFYGQEKICNLPIEDENHNDRMVFLESDLETRHSTKIRVFTWRVDNEILPTNVKIASVHRGFGQACPRCGADYETLVHALKDYPISRATLMFGGLDSSIIFKKTGYGVIVRDVDGFVLGGGGGFKEMQLSVEEAKWYAFDESIKIACRLNIKGDVIF